MVQCGQMANGRTASRWSLGREANLQPGTSWLYVLWLIHNVAATAREADAAAERAAELKISKYSGLDDKCVFQPIAIESLGPLNETACQVLKDLGRRISAQSGDERECLSDSTLSCSTTILRRQTTWANGHSSVYIFQLFFSSSPSVSEMPWAPKK